MDLRCILYVSSATRALNDMDMVQLLEASRRRNLAASVTGLLLHRDGNFMQYFEGPPEGVAHIYRIVQRSALHKDITEILDDAIHIRLFPLWTMAYRNRDFDAFSDPKQYEAILQPEVYAKDPLVSPVLRLLNEFWNAPGHTARS